VYEYGYCHGNRECITHHYGESIACFILYWRLGNTDRQRGNLLYVDTCHGSELHQLREPYCKPNGYHHLYRNRNEQQRMHEYANGNRNR
jgi:hypothetical protein